MNKPAPSPFWLFTVFFLGLMFLPRLVTQGMFGDGLLYASLARNLAEGRGSLWAPFFSTGYFVPFASGNPYFENPPLMIWLQGGLFRLLGDFWWVEKLYTLLLFVLNAWLLVRVWETPLRGTPLQGKYGWLPLLGWYLIPSAIWGNPNNLMDNNLLTFCLLALWCALDGLYSGQKTGLKLTLAGLCVYLGLMTKGPVALYPVAAPFLLALTTLRSPRPEGRPPGNPSSADPAAGRSLAAAFLQSAWIGLAAAGLFVLMLALIPEARTYFQNYWEKRLGVVISGARADAALTGWARLSIFPILAGELAGLAVVAATLFFVLKRRGEGLTSSQPLATHGMHRTALLFLLLGFSATLPLVLSARQSGMYIIAGLPMFALAAAYWLLPLLHQRLEVPGPKTGRFLHLLRIVSLAGLAFVFFYSIALFGRPGREKALLHDLPVIRQAIPAGEKVAVCDNLMNNLHAHTYLQRYHRLELSRDTAGCRYLLTDRECAGETGEGWVELARGEEFGVYLKNE